MHNPQGLQSSTPNSIQKGGRYPNKKFLNQSGWNSDNKGHATFAVSLVRKSYLFLAMKQQGSTGCPETRQNSSSLVTSAVTWVEGDGVPNS